MPASLPDDLTRLHELSTRLTRVAELQPLLEDILDAAIAVMGADFGNVQLLDPPGSALKIEAQRGFHQDFLDHFDSVHEGAAACGLALQRRERVVVEDICADPSFAQYQAIAASAGFRAVQSTPLFARSGQPLGMISTHFRHVHRPSDRELCLMDLYARLAEGAIESKRAGAALEAAKLTEGNRIDGALRASEERFRRYFDLGLIGMAITSPTKGIVEVNDELCRILGYERGELLKLTWAEITHPDDLAADVAQFDRVIAGEIDGYSLDKRWIRGDGRVINSTMSAKCVRRLDNSVDYFVGLVQDITERKQAEEGLRRSEELFRLSIEGIKDYAIVTLDADGRVMTWNAGAERINGYRADEIMGRHFSLFYEPADVRAHKPETVLRVAVETGRSEDEGWRVRANGSRFWAIVVVTVLTDETGYPLRFVKVTRDMTAPRRAEEELRRSAAYLAEGQSVSQTGSWGWDLATDELYWSDEHFRICGVDVKQFTPSHAAFFDLVHSEERSAVRERFEAAIGERRDYEGHFRLVLPSGEVRHVHRLAHPRRNAAGEVIEYVGTLIDTSERWRAEAALKSAFDQIKQLKDQLAQEKQYLEEEIRAEHGFEEIIGESSALKHILKQVKSVAPTDSTVLIQGETGTGKELIARAIHNLSTRRERTFVKINCAAIPEGLLESELFGHEKGAFTGAFARRTGRFELADGGSIFLDEVGDIPLALQPKLLRVLQEHEFERVGGTRTLHVNVRIIAATNRDLDRMVEDKQYRVDLYYRIRVFPLMLPPLRERSQDIPRLIEHFTRKYARQLNKPIKSVPVSTMDALCQYPWPGNIRELENVVERSAILSSGSTLEVPLGELKLTASKRETDVSTLEHVEREHILRVLNNCKWVIGGAAGAAVALGIKRTSLQHKMKKLGITRKSPPAGGHE